MLTKRSSSMEEQYEHESGEFFEIWTIEEEKEGEFAEEKEDAVAASFFFLAFFEEDDDEEADAEDDELVNERLAGPLSQ